MTSRRSAALAWVLVGCTAIVVVRPTPALAQEDARYDALIADAVREYEAGHYEEARAFFRQAHRAVPNPRTLRGIGMSAYELREYADAYRALSEALRFPASARDLSAAQRAHVETLLDRTGALVAIYGGLPEGALARVDGRETPREPDGSLVVAIGRHTIEITTREGTRRTIEVDVAGGEREPLVLDTDAQPTAQPAPSPIGTAEPIEREPTIRPVAPQITPVGGVAVVRTPTVVLDGTREPLVPPPPPPTSWWQLELGGGIGAYEGGSARYATAGSLTLDARVLWLVAPGVSLGGQLGVSYASLAESNAPVETSWWLAGDVLLALDVRLSGTPVRLHAGLGPGIGARGSQPIRVDGARERERAGVWGALALEAGARVFVIDEVLYVGGDLRAMLGGYASIALAVLLGVEIT